MPDDERRWWHRGAGRRSIVRLFVLVFVVLSAMLVGLSPLALDSFGGSATSWTRGSADASFTGRGDEAVGALAQQVGGDLRAQRHRVVGRSSAV